jgi:uncharacterized protein
VKLKKDFIVPFKGLADGEHTFEFNVSRLFFEEYCGEDSDFNDGSFSVVVVLIKKYNILTINFDIKGSVVSACDRCLDDIDVKLDIQEVLYAKISNEEIDESDFITISPDEFEIDVSQYIYEIISINMPLRKVHEEKKCNKDMISRLKDLAVNEDEVDPRWDKLKDLLNN